MTVYNNHSSGYYYLQNNQLIQIVFLKTCIHVQIREGVREEKDKHYIIIILFN